jgi:hypothetical protein
VKLRTARVPRTKAGKESSELRNRRTRGQDLLVHGADVGHVDCVYDKDCGVGRLLGSNGLEVQ